MGLWGRCCWRGLLPLPLLPPPLLLLPLKLLGLLLLRQGELLTPLLLLPLPLRQHPLSLLLQAAHQLVNQRISEFQEGVARRAAAQALDPRCAALLVAVLCPLPVLSGTAGSSAGARPQVCCTVGAAGCVMRFAWRGVRRCWRLLGSLRPAGPQLHSLALTVYLPPCPITGGRGRRRWARCAAGAAYERRWQRRAPPPGAPSPCSWSAALCAAWWSSCAGACSCSTCMCVKLGIWHSAAPLDYLRSIQALVSCSTAVCLLRPFPCLPCRCRATLRSSTSSSCSRRWRGLPSSTSAGAAAAAAGIGCGPRLQALPPSLCTCATTQPPFCHKAPLAFCTRHGIGRQCSILLRRASVPFFCKRIPGAPLCKHATFVTQRFSKGLPGSAFWDE